MLEPGFGLTFQDLYSCAGLRRVDARVPTGLDDEYFRQLTAERRTPEKRHGFVVYRWTKDETQANEGLDTMLQADRGLVGPSAAALALVVEQI